MSHPELEFFNTISGQLKIELTEAAEQIGNLANQKATPEAKIVSVELKPEIFQEEAGTFRELTPEEQESVAFRGAEITMQGEVDIPVTHKAPNAEFFTVKQLLDAVEETERQTRGQSEWFDGVDIHHVFFEGIEEEEPGVWQICWGS